ISDVTTDASFNNVVDGTTVLTEFTEYTSGFITKVVGPTEQGFLLLVLGGTRTTHHEGLLYINTIYNVVVC
ncbi:hypothetical protein, partial [Lysinibacillus sp. D3C2_S12]|uniref:hypothetical protein n=1 Tax=Lysinibacillus sp. D3C2_S12 TaxID=2941226 RepID=UPI0020BE7BC6